MIFRSILCDKTPDGKYLYMNMHFVLNTACQYKQQNNFVFERFEQNLQRKNKIKKKQTQTQHAFEHFVFMKTTQNLASTFLKMSTNLSGDYAPDKNIHTCNMQYVSDYLY